MRSARSQYVLLTVLMAVPLVLALVGWPAFARWVTTPPADTAPQVATATAAPTALEKPAGSATSRPTASAAGRATTVATTQRNQLSSTPSTVNTPAAAPTESGATDPSAAVQDFYARVAAHDFEDAAALWSPRMRANFPPAENIDQRFSATRALTLQRAEVVSETADRAAVAVELDEARADGQHHWTGTWQVVRGPDGWLLDQPQLQGR